MRNFWELLSLSQGRFIFIFIFILLCVTVTVSDKVTGADLGQGAQGARASPLAFLRKKIEYMQRIQKHNIKKICQLESRLNDLLNDHC